MILKKEKFHSNTFDSASFITTKKLITVLDHASEFRDELISTFKVDVSVPQVVQVGNANKLLDAIEALDAQCVKIDIVSNVKDVQLLNLLESEKATFEILSITENQILSEIKSDKLVAETRYSAKVDLLDYYSFSKFANYCRDLEYEELVCKLPCN